MTKAEAEALWTKLSNLWEDLDQTILEIVQTKSWEPLGYRSFAEAWAARGPKRMP